MPGLVYSLLQGGTRLKVPHLFHLHLETVTLKDAVTLVLWKPRTQIRKTKENCCKIQPQELRARASDQRLRYLLACLCVRVCARVCASVCARLCLCFVDKHVVFKV